MIFLFLFHFYFQFFSLSQLRATRAVSEHSVPIIAWIVAGAGAVIRLFGPESIGGIGDIGARIDAEVACSGLSADEIGNKVHISITSLWTGRLMLYPKILYHTEGKLIQIAGLPAMYDYEFHPQKVRYI